MTCKNKNAERKKNVVSVKQKTTELIQCNKKNENTKDELIQQLYNIFQKNRNNIRKYSATISAEPLSLIDPVTAVPAISLNFCTRGRSISI